jgi:DedD protein
MRFEVKGGGIAAIVFAMTLLSGAVFVLGLLAGYDVGRQAQLDTAQLATSYPLQSAPSSGAPPNPSPAEPGNPAVQSASTTASPATAGSTPVTAASAADRSIARDSVSPKLRASQPSATPARQRLASSSIPSATEPPPSTAGSSAADEDMSADESENPEADDASSEASSNPNVQARRRVASTTPSARHKPYNIQIQAAMDISGADQMMARFQKLGYPSHLVPTEIAGQRWYKVEVGPYATPEEASRAEAQLRQKYDTAYGGVAHDNSSGQTSANDNSDE